MSTETLSIAYDGPALSGHEIDARIIAPALLALSDLFEEANKILNGNRAKIALNIRGSFKNGSFGIDISVCQNLIQSITNFTTSQHVKSASNIVSLLGLDSRRDKVNGVINLLKKLQGRQIKQTESDEFTAKLYIDKK